MGTNTIGKLMKYGSVPVGKPNEGDPSYEDATAENIRTEAELTNESKRAVKVLSLLASTASNTFDPTIARTVIIDMDADITNLTISVDGEFDGQLLMFIVKQDITGGRVLSWDLNKFQGGLDQGVPALNGTASSRDYILTSWNSNDQKFDFLGQERRYP